MSKVTEIVRNDIAEGHREISRTAHCNYSLTLVETTEPHDDEDSVWYAWSIVELGEISGDVDQLMELSAHLDYIKRQIDKLHDELRDGVEEG